jgi:hypothetical protein
MNQIKNVSKAVRRGLKAKSAEAGRSRSDESLGELREIDRRPTLAEFCERLHKRRSLTVSLDTPLLVREGRATR